MQPEYYRYQIMNGELDGKPYFGVVDTILEVMVAESDNIEEMLNFMEQRESADFRNEWSQI